MTIHVSNQVLNDYIEQIREVLYQARQAGFSAQERTALQKLVDEMTPIYDLRARVWGGERVGGKPGGVDTAIWASFLAEYARAVTQLSQLGLIRTFIPPGSRSATSLGPGTMMASMSYADRIRASQHVLPGHVDKSPKTDIDEVIEDVVDEGADEAINGNGIHSPFDDGGLPPSFFEQHKTKLFIGGGIVAALLIGGGLLAAQRSDKLSSKRRSKRNPIEEDDWWSNEPDYDFDDPQFRYLEDPTLADVVATEPRHILPEERLLQLPFSDDFARYIRAVTGKTHPTQDEIVDALMAKGLTYNVARQYASGEEYWDLRRGRS